MQKRSYNPSKINLQKVGLVIILLILFSLLINAFSASLFFRSKDRITTVFYNEKTRLYSFGEANYSLYFYPDLKIFVPGGYGNYRVGGLGKLVSLENKPVLLKNAFSAASSTFVDYYFYPKKEIIYYGKNKDKSLQFPGFQELFFYESNTSFLDRLYLYSKFLTAKKADFTQLEAPNNKSEDKNVEIFDQENFAKTYQGYFYQKTYRNEKANVQILYYKSYDTAQLIGHILDSTGIRVVDLSQDDRKIKGCLVIKQKSENSSTASSLADFFKCELKIGKTNASDIILELGQREAEWSVD